MALVPPKALCTTPSQSGSAGSVELHRRLSNPPQSHHLVASIMFGIAGAESVLLNPTLTKGDPQMFSKSITMWPINDHFSRVISLANKCFEQYPLKIGLYQRGVTFRTRLIPPNGKPARG